MKIAPRIKDEVAPLRNTTTSLLPPRFTFSNISQSAQAELRKKYPSKLLLEREISMQGRVKKCITFFPEDEGK